MPTTFAKSRNPWTGQHMTKDNKPRASAQLIDIASLSLSNDPIPTHRKVVGSKYDDFFASLKIGGPAIKCPAGTAASKLATALRKYAERQRWTCDIKTMSDYGDGFGRVWLIAKDAPKLKRAA
jgi:hypothetical protein